MKVLIVDDAIGDIDLLSRMVREVMGEETKIYTADNGEDALAIVRDKHVNVMFLDIELPRMNGLEIARRSKKAYPRTNVVFCTAHEQYALKAWELFISGYILKPVSLESVRTVLNNLRTPIVKRLRIQCFGHFEVFHSGTVAPFKRKGAKEMLAYLVCVRGAGVTSGELCEVLRTEEISPDLKKASVRKYAAEIRKTLSQLGFDDVLCHTRDNYYINTEKLDCDYYRYMDGDPRAVNLFNGQFMRQYSWAEMEIGHLFSLVD